jgi:hypothetical protein
MKGIFYSTITILFIVPILFFAFVYMDAVKTASEGSTSKAIADRIVSFSKSIDSDLPRAANIIVRRSIESNINYIATNGIALDDAEARISESMLNGTVFGSSTILNNFTITSWASVLRSKGAAYGFDTDIDIISINITPLDSYHISVGVIIFVNITDMSKTTNLYRIYNTNIPISIEGLVDPLYLLNTNGLIKRTIKAPGTTVYGATNVDAAVAGKYYMQSGNGPSFLDRLEGRLTGAYTAENTIGLETFVYLPELQANGLPVKTDQNSIDYLYFSSSSQPGQAVSGSAYGWLRLNSEQAAVYGVTLI